MGQLLIEVHWPMHRGEFKKKAANRQLAELHKRFFGVLEDAGFAVAHVEFNTSHVATRASSYSSGLTAEALYPLMAHG